MQVNVGLRNVRLPTETHFHVGELDEAARIQPARHIFPEERLWLIAYR